MRRNSCGAPAQRASALRARGVANRTGRAEKTVMCGGSERVGLIKPQRCRDAEGVMLLRITRRMPAASGGVVRGQQRRVLLQ